MNIDKGYLKYVIENCITAFDMLCETNKELNIGMRKKSTADVNKLGAHDRMIKDYLIMRVAGLFDKDSRNISLVISFPGNSVINRIRKEKIIKKIISKRHKFVAHSSRNSIGRGNFGIQTQDICNSNLKELLLELGQLV